MAWLWKRGRPTWVAVAGLGILGYKTAQWLRQDDLRGEVVLITGGSRGLGLALAREFARMGCRLVLCARDPDELEQTRLELSKHGAEVLGVPCDVTDQAQVHRLVQETQERFGRVDILVNNAGAIQVGPLASTTLQDFEAAMAVMFWGMLYPTLAVLPQMRQQRRGRIVNITSIGGMVSMPHLLPYTCAKFAAQGLSEGLRAELHREGIQVTTIVPGLMRTGSYLQARFRGQHTREFTWFALGATLPLLSMDATRAARQIVQATRRGQAERILSLPANLLGRLHGLFPGLTTNLLALGNRLLPGAHGSSTTSVPGMAIQQRLRSPVFQVITGLGRSAARHFRQYRHVPGQSSQRVSSPPGEAPALRSQGPRSGNATT